MNPSKFHPTFWTVIVSIFYTLFNIGISQGQVPADSLMWVRTGGPPGGLGYDIRYNFDNPDMWYVTDNNAGVHISMDNGLTWQPANAGIPPQSGPTGDAIPIFSLTVDPNNPQIVWVGTNPTGHIYKSTDGGWTWERKDNGVTVEYAGGLTFRGFTVHPYNSDIVYAMGETSDPVIGFAVWGPGTGGVVYKTEDGGDNWENIWDGGIPSSLARYMCIDPRDTQVLYVSTGIFDRGAVGEPSNPLIAEDPFGGLGILKSTDGGDTWDFLDEDNGLNMLYIGSLFMHPENPDILLAAAGHIVPGTAADHMTDVGYSPAGVYRTSNGGDTWTQVLTPPLERIGECFTSVEIHPVFPNVAYAGSATAIYRSKDAGITWAKVSTGEDDWGPPGITAGWPIDLQCDPRDTNRIFANNYNGGNFLSEDGGVTWHNASTGYTGAQMRRVDVDPLNPARAYAAGRSGLWRTDNGGGLWEGIFYPPEGDGSIPGIEWLAIAADPHKPEHILASLNVIMESSDGGNSWEVRKTMQEIDDEIPGDTTDISVTAFMFSSSDSNIVYANLCAEGLCLGHERAEFIWQQESGGVLISEDGGTTWERSKDENIQYKSVLDIAVDPTNANTAYAATYGGIYRTNNLGENWELLTGLPDNTLVRTVAVNPNNPLHILTGLEGLGIYVSRDGGETWQIGYAGLESNGSLHDIVFDPIDSDIVYTSDYYSGIYRSVNGGDSWEKINNNLSNRACLGLSVSSNGQHLYAATDGGGVYRLDINGVPTGVKQIESLPVSFQLEQNFPNPFNQSTNIQYHLLNNSPVRLQILNLKGQIVRSLVNEKQFTGIHAIQWDGTNQQGISVSSGIYFYRLITPSYQKIQKMTLIK